MKIRIVKQNKAVSEVLGTILLLAISVSIFSVVYASFFSVQVSPAMPSVNIVGSIDEGYLVLEHYGGESLSLDTKVIMYFDAGGSSTASIIINDYLDQTSKDDGKWDIGEVSKVLLSDISGYQQFQPIDIMVVDQESNSAIMQGRIQEIQEPPKYADLEINYIGCNPNVVSEVSTNVNVRFKVMNSGEGDSSGFDYSISLEGTLAVPMTQQVYPLNANQISDFFTVPLLLPDQEPTDGSYEVKLEIWGEGTDYDSDLTYVIFNGVDKADLAITSFTASNYNPDAYNDIITITAQVKNNGPDVATNAKVDCFLPNGLLYVSATYAPNGGNYDKNTGVWDIGDLDVSETRTLEIKAIATVLPSEVEFTQFGIVIDGSDSITQDEFTMMLQGISSALTSGSIPRNGKVELTIVQMGKSYPLSWPYYSSKVEVGPVVINDVSGTPGYYLTVASNVLAIQKIGGYSPLSDSMKLIANTLKTSTNFNSNNIQILNFATDGMANIRPPKQFPTNCYELPDGRVICIADDDDPEIPEYTDALDEISRSDISNYKNYIISTLQLTSNQDEINALGIEGLHGCDVAWLRDEFVWPEPGYLWSSTEPAGPGWVRIIDTSTKLKESLNYQINSQFIPRIMDCDAHSDILDPNDANNHAQITITPN